MFGSSPEIPSESFVMFTNGFHYKLQLLLQQLLHLFHFAFVS